MYIKIVVFEPLQLFMEMTLNTKKMDEKALSYDLLTNNINFQVELAGLKYLKGLHMASGL